MFKKLTYLFIASLLILSSCGKQEVVASNDLNNDTSNRIYAPKQDVLFHYSFENEATGELKGWIIDKDGLVRTYDFTNATDVPELPKSFDVSEEAMNNLLDYSTAIDMQIDLEVLKDKYNKISHVALGGIDVAEDGAAGEGTTSIVAYHYVEICDDYNPTHHQMIILETFGKLNQTNAMSAATALTDWLKEVQSDVNL